MQLLEGILYKILAKEKIEVLFPNLKIDAEEIVNLECYRLLQEIQTIVKDCSLTDDKCFIKIEKIIRVFEDAGIECGDRHTISK